MAGGLDTFDWLKDRIKRPSVVVDLSQVAELRGIKDVERRPRDRRADDAHRGRARIRWCATKFGLLTRGGRARGLAADSQPGDASAATCRRTRAAGITAPGGRATGRAATSATPTRRRRSTASTRFCDADRCVAVNPSDTAPALIALDAQMVIQSARRRARGRRPRTTSSARTIDITRMTVLAPGELLTAIRIPATWAGAQFYFEKVRDRNVWDFPLVNVASAMKYSRPERSSACAWWSMPRRRGRCGCTRWKRRSSGKPRNERDGGARRADGDRRGAAAALQRLQDSADAEPGEAGHSRRRGRHMDFVKWGLNPWGQNILTHVSWTLFWASLFAGVMFLVAHGSYMLLSAHRKRPGDRDRQAGSGPREPARRASSGTR